jgi:sodium/potassium-transporting ATPase subunit alpha
LVPKKCKVLRDGAMAVLDASELVPGDIVEYQEGDQVPADLRVTFAYNLKVDNSSLTGESEAQERVADAVEPAGVAHGHGGAANGGGTSGTASTPAIEANNLLFFSTIVVSGHGRGLVVGTGDNTVMGQIAGLTAESGGGDTTPPLIREINNFIK